MLETSTPARTWFGRGLLVAFGWYATLTAAFVVAVAGIPARPRQPEDCDVLFNCVPPGRFVLAVAVLVGLPGLAVLSVVSMVLLAALKQVVRSPVAAGTIAALSPSVLCGVGLLALAAH